MWLTIIRRLILVIKIIRVIIILDYLNNICNKNENINYYKN